MLAVRYEWGNSGDNLDAILEYVQDNRTKRVMLFASPTKSVAGLSDDIPDSNLPVVAALAEYSIPRVGIVYVAFDGNFLTAQRRPRYLELKALLDIGIASGRVFFSKDRIPFTKPLEPHEAVTQMLSLSSLSKLTLDTRKDYFDLLSIVPEERM